MSGGTAIAERADVGDTADTLYYLYGVTHAGTKLPDVSGVGEVRPRLLESDGLALLAGEVPPGVTVATRENLLAHSHLLDAVAQHATVLPMRFGMLVEDLDAVSADMLGSRRDEYLAQLTELDGAVQFSLRATYDEDVVLAEIVGEDEEIRRLSEATRGVPEEAMPAERVRLGELVVGAFGAKRPADADALLDRARAVARAAVTRASGAPASVVDAALLVDRERTGELEEQLERLARELAPRIRLRLVGPQAPYDFVAN